MDGPRRATKRARLAGFWLAGLLAACPAVAPAEEPCRNSGEFGAWMADFRREAAASGISPATISAALDGITLQPGIISRDRRQGFFWQDFLAFSARLATADRIAAGKKRIAANAAVFARIDRDYGVPAEVIASFWALESDFGQVMGKDPILPSLATLAYDCRRGAMFRAQLLDALRLVERGDLAPREMIGSWAGELGQTQFLPSHYFRHAVDYDGDGKRNLLRSTPDVLASSAAYLASVGWRRGEPWIEEVRVPAEMAWEEADLSIVHPVDYWTRAGVRRAGGDSLDPGAPAASLLLPMGRKGPAFLAYPNFHAYLEWNESQNYALTAAYLATRISGAPAMRRGNAAVPPFGMEQVRKLQALLLDRGYDIGKVDGKLGVLTRGAVRDVQRKLGLPADAYPTPELLGRLAGG